MKQLSLPLLVWKFKKFINGSVIERQYSNGKETLRLFWDGKRDLLREVYRDGKLLVEDTFEQVRERASVSTL